MAEVATPLPRDSEELARVKYLLSLSLRTSDVSDVKVWSVANPQTSVPYERKTRGKLRLDAWVDSRDLDADNSMSDVCARGFRFGAEGRMFNTGNIDMDSDDRGTQRFLLCEVGVGRSYVMDTEAGSREVPAGYDSLYVAPRIDRDADGVISSDEYSIAAALAGRPPEAYSHKYILLDPGQVLPKYIVHFTYDPASADSPAVMCEVCETEEAELHCSRCPGNLCPTCDQDVHGANKLVARHKRVALGAVSSTGGVRARLEALKSRLGDGFAIQSVCPNHEHTQVSYFCRVCFVPVCVDCKMMGSHSSGEFAHHPLTPIVTAYEEALATSSAVDPMVEARKKAINGRLGALSARLTAVTENANAVEEEIYSKLQEALHQLKEERQRKVAVLLGEELELRRQLEHIAWTEAFLTKQQDTLAPAAFLDAWACHSKLTEDMQMQAVELADTSLLETVKPDIKMFGHVVVMSDSEAAEHARNLGRAPEPGEGALAAPAIIAGIKNYVRATDAPAALGVGFAPTVSGGGSLALPAAAGAGGRAGVHGRTSGSSLADSMWRSVLREGMQSDASAVGPARTKHRGFGGSTVPRSPAALRAGRKKLPSRAAAPPAPPAAPAATAAVVRAIQARAAAYSLSKDAARKRRQRADLGEPLPEHIFPDSRILTAATARTLYDALPLTIVDEIGDEGELESFATYVESKLAFATYNNFPATMAGFSRELKESKLNGPSVVIVRSGDQVFGGYCADPWDFNGKFGGSTAAFLFSITRDCKIPYHGRIKGPGQRAADATRGADAAAGRMGRGVSRDADLLRQGGVTDEELLRGLEAERSGGRVYDDGEEESKGIPPKGTDCVRSDHDTIQFGVRDLILRGDLSACTSELEYSYGVGFRPDSVEAKTMLAGSPTFAVDDLEIWAVGTFRRDES